MKVLLTWQASDAEIAAFAAVLPSGSVVAPAPSPGFSRFDCTLEAIAPHLHDADAIVGWVLPEGALERTERLKLLCWMHAGCDELDFARLKAMDVRVTNIRGANSVAVAEHAIALLMGLAKRLTEARADVVEARAYPYYEPSRHSATLAGRTVGIVGLGQIGTEIARRLRAFDMRVLATRRHADRSNGAVDAVYGPDRLHDMLALSDYVVLALPMTRETDGLFGDAAFAALKPGAFLVNIARGNLVQESALVTALHAGRLAGYGTDVWWFYANAYLASYHFPTPSRTGVHRHPRVLGTGGQASNADDVVDRSLQRALESVAAFVRGEPLRWSVDLDRGY